MYKVIFKQDTKGHDIVKTTIKADSAQFIKEKGYRCYRFFDQNGICGEIKADNIIAWWKV